MLLEEVHGLVQRAHLIPCAGVHHAAQQLGRTIIGISQRPQMLHDDAGALHVRRQEVFISGGLGVEVLVQQDVDLAGVQSLGALTTLQVLGGVLAEQLLCPPPCAGGLLLGRVHRTGGEVHGVTSLLAQGVCYAAQALVSALGGCAGHGERTRTHGAAEEVVQVVAAVTGGVTVRVQVAQSVLRAFALQVLRRTLHTHRRQGAATERGRSHLAQGGHACLADELPAQHGGQCGIERCAAERLDVGRSVQVLPRCTSHQLRVAHGVLHELALELLVVHAVGDSRSAPAQCLAGELSHRVLRHAQQPSAGVHGGRGQDRVLHGRGTLADVLQRPGGGVADAADVFDPAHLGGVQALALLQRSQLSLERIRLSVLPVGAQGCQLRCGGVGVRAELPTFVGLAQGAHVLDLHLFQSLLGETRGGEVEGVAETGHVGSLLGDVHALGAQECKFVFADLIAGQVQHAPAAQVEGVVAGGHAVTGEHTAELSDLPPLGPVQIGELVESGVGRVPADRL